MSATDLVARNRLDECSSPYLLQHADNPVHWQPWGPEALAAARAADKPIFLSVGYATCHWCHVMAHESFERQDVADLLNEHFIPVKVDREERPDIDEIYINATQLMTGRGGWPNSVWLTPDGRPFYAGTYFPPEDRGGMAGFKTILRQLAEAWRTRRQDVEAQADKLAEAIRGWHGHSASCADDHAYRPPNPDDRGHGHPGENDRAGAEPIKLGQPLVDRALDALRPGFDRRHGGFGHAPKFPPHATLRLLIRRLRQRDDPALREMLVKTLDAMARGGIHDHVGGGFHRYATDAEWLVPHFEKMLYDNAQLARVYAEAYALTEDEDHRRAAEGICTWVLREMTDPAGGFHSALDADSEGIEGKFYVWTRREILDALGEDEGELFCRVFDVRDEGNFEDNTLQREREDAPPRGIENSPPRERGVGVPPREQGSRHPNILHLSRPVEVSARVEGVPVDTLEARVRAGLDKLLARRADRVRPGTDDKVLAAWNGLMITGLAVAGRRLERPEYTAAAERAADFVLGQMSRDGRLLRSWRRGRAGGEAFLEDYAFLADGLLTLYEETCERRRLEQAETLMGTLEEHYRAEGGGYYFTADDGEELLARIRSPYDQATPSGNGVAAQVLLRLAALTGKDEYAARARRLLESFADAMAQAPQATMALLEGVDMSSTGVLPVDGWHGQLPLSGSDHAYGRPHLEISKHGHPQTTRNDHATQGPIRAAASVRGTARPGGQVEVVVEVTIDPPFHVSSAEPLSEDLTPTSLRLVSAPPGAKLAGVAYPPPREITLRSQELSVYESSFTLRADVALSVDLKPGIHELTLELRLQPCDDQRCLAPQTHRLVVPVTTPAP